MNFDKVTKKIGVNSSAGLADYIGVSEHTVNRWEREGDCPKNIKLLLKYIEKHGRI